MAGVRLHNMAWLRICKSRVSHRGFAVVQVVLCDCESQWQRSGPQCQDHRQPTNQQPTRYCMPSCTRSLQQYGATRPISLLGSWLSF